MNNEPVWKALSAVGDALHTHPGAKVTNVNLFGIPGTIGHAQGVILGKYNLKNIRAMINSHRKTGFAPEAERMHFFQNNSPQVMFDQQLGPVHNNTRVPSARYPTGKSRKPRIQWTTKELDNLRPTQKEYAKNFEKNLIKAYNIHRRRMTTPTTIHKFPNISTWKGIWKNRSHLRLGMYPAIGAAELWTQEKWNKAIKNGKNLRIQNTLNLMKSL